MTADGSCVVPGNGDLVVAPKGTVALDIFSPCCDTHEYMFSLKMNTRCSEPLSSGGLTLMAHGLMSNVRKQPLA